MKKRLYVGLDESNHGRDPEIIVAVFSQIEGDAAKSRIRKRIIKKGQSRSGNDYRMGEIQAKRFIAHERRDLRYASVPRELLERDDRDINLSPIIRVAPCLIGDYLDELSSGVQLNILIDGDVRSLEIDRLGTSLSRVVSSKKNHKHSIGGISYYPKSKNGSFVYPKILVAADSFAHYIFRQESFRRKMEEQEKEVVYG